MRQRVGVLVAVGGAMALGSAGAMAASTGASGTTGSSGTTGATTKPTVVACQAGIASSSVGAVQWLWSAYGKPTSSNASVRYAVVGGKGTWRNGQAKGTICSEEEGGGEPNRSIDLAVAGAARLTPGAKELGLIGVALTLPVSVSKSGDDAVCPVGATGTVSLFASYYSVHRDEASLRFGGSCAAWDETFTGSVLHVGISHNGAEIRPPTS